MEDYDIPPYVERNFFSLLEERKEGKPLQYLMGEWDFFGRTFRVKEGVLIPRPETELLVEKVLDLLPNEKRLEGYEIGVGSGCISITLLSERPLLSMTGCDINPSAVELSRENARLHNVEDRLEVYVGDMFSPVRGRKFDFVVSNPPYIPAGRWKDLPEEVKREGYSSLIGGEKGYEFYERFAEEVCGYLREGGFVALEIGHDQGKKVRDILGSAGFEVKIFKDLSGQDRVVVGWR